MNSLQVAPLRTCLYCGLEAKTKEELSKFVSSKQHNYGHQNCCLKCRRAQSRELFFIFSLLRSPLWLLSWTLRITPSNCIVWMRILMNGPISRGKNGRLKPQKEAPPSVRLFLRLFFDSQVIDSVGLRIDYSLDCSGQSTQHRIQTRTVPGWFAESMDADADGHGSFVPPPPIKIIMIPDGHEISNVKQDSNVSFFMDGISFVISLL